MITNEKPLKYVEIALIGYYGIFICVCIILAFDHHIYNHSDRKQIQIPYGNA